MIEGESTKLTTDFLSFTDSDSEPAGLTYALLEGPSLGELFIVGNEGEELDRVSERKGEKERERERERKSSRI